MLLPCACNVLASVGACQVVATGPLAQGRSGPGVYCIDMARTWHTRGQAAIAWTSVAMLINCPSHALARDAMSLSCHYPAMVWASLEGR